MDDSLIYGINGFVIGLGVLIFFFLCWFFYAAWKEGGFSIISPSSWIKIVKYRMKIQLEKITFGVWFFKWVYAFFFLLFAVLIFFISIGLSVRLEINFLGL